MQLGEVGGVFGKLEHGVVEGQQNRIEGMALQRVAVHPRHRDAVPGNADVARQPLLARPDQRLERAAGAQRLAPLLRFGEAVQLDEVHLVHLQAPQ